MAVNSSVVIVTSMIISIIMIGSNLWLRTDGVNTNGAAAQVMNLLADWGKRCALALLGR